MHARAHTHAHTHCSRNWVLVLVRMEMLWEEVGFQFGLKRWQGWAMSKILWEWIPNAGSKARDGVKAASLAFVLFLTIGFYCNSPKSWYLQNSGTNRLRGKEQCNGNPPWLGGLRNAGLSQLEQMNLPQGARWQRTFSALCTERCM